MAQERQKENSLVAQQQAHVDKLAAQYNEKPSPELLAELKRRSDLLLHLKNIEKGNPSERAREAATTAWKTTIDRAIKVVPKG